MVVRDELNRVYPGKVRGGGGGELSEGGRGERVGCSSNVGGGLKKYEREGMGKKGRREKSEQLKKMN